MLMAQAEVAVAVAAASQATAASAAACANVTKVETAVAAEHSAGIDASAIEAALVQTKKDCDTAKALAKNLTETAHALNATMWAKVHNETAIEIRKKRYEDEMVECRIEPWRWPCGRHPLYPYCTLTLILTRLRSSRRSSGLMMRLWTPTSRKTRLTRRPR